MFDRRPTDVPRTSHYLVLTRTRNNLKRSETTWNDLQRPATSKKRPETTYNELQRTRNDLKRPITKKKRPENDLQRARNNLKGPTTSKTQPTTTRTYYNEQKKRRETTNNKQILRLFYNMGPLVLLSDTFLTQHLVAIIRALLHGESWWKYSAKHFYIIMCIYYGI